MSQSAGKHPFDKLLQPKQELKLVIQAAVLVQAVFNKVFGFHFFRQLLRVTQPINSAHQSINISMKPTVPLSNRFHNHQTHAQVQ